MEIALLDVSAVTGLCAMVTLTVNVLFGMLLSTGYKTSRWWKKLPMFLRKMNIRRLHNQTAYLALLLVLVHPVLLVFDKDTKFRLADIVFPLHAPHQRFFVLLGTLAMFALIVVIITTQQIVKRKMTFRLWKNIHLVSYATAMLFIVHGFKMDPELKDRATDWFDGEKLVCWACLFILLAASWIRIKYHRQSSAREDQFSATG